MSQFIRQWRKDIRDLGTPEFDAAAALRDMMARRADIQNLASNEQRMALDLQDESRKKESHPLELEGKRQANTSLGLANKRFPEDAAIRDEGNLRLRADEDQKRRADLVRSQNVQLKNQVALGEIPAGEIAPRAGQVASMVGAEAALEDDFEGPPAPVSPRERELLAGEVARGAEVPFDAKAGRFEEDRKARVRESEIKAQKGVVEELRKNLKQSIEAANNQTRNAQKEADRKVNLDRNRFQSHDAALARLTSGMNDVGVKLSPTEIESDLQMLNRAGVPRESFRPKGDGSMAYTVDANASDLIDRAYAQSFAASVDVAGVDKREIALYAYNKARLERELQRLISMTRGEKQEPASLPAEVTVKKDEPIRQPGRKIVKPKAPERKAEFRVPETTKADETPAAGSAADPRQSQREAKLRELQRTDKSVVEVRPFIWRHPSGKFVDTRTGAWVPDPSVQQ